MIEPSNLSTFDPAESAPRKRARKIIAVLASVVLFVVIGIQWVVISRQGHEQSSLKKEIAQLSAQVQAQGVQGGATVSQVDSRVNDLSSQLDDQSITIDSLTQCVNDYMDTIGRWTSNVFSYWRWTYC